MSSSPTQAVAYPYEQVIRRGAPRMMLANNASAASAFPSFALTSLTPFAGVDAAGDSTARQGNYAVIPASKGVTTMVFGGTGSNDETMKVRVYALLPPVIPQDEGSEAAEYVALHVADLTATLSSTPAGQAGGVLGGTGVLLADTLVEDFATTQANTVSPASDTVAYTEIGNVGNDRWAVLFHRNSSATDCNGFYFHT